jgi:hypothetical protein
MKSIHAPKRLAGGLMAFVFALVIAQAAAAALPRGEFRYHDGEWLKEQRYHPLATPTAVQYRYHDGRWIGITPKGHAKVVIKPVSRPDDRAGVRGVG